MQRGSILDVRIPQLCGGVCNQTAPQQARSGRKCAPAVYVVQARECEFVLREGF